jgi:hypothetical protein
MIWRKQAADHPFGTPDLRIACGIFTSTMFFGTL